MNNNKTTKQLEPELRYREEDCTEMKDNQFEKEIEEVKIIIQAWEDTDPYFIDDEVKELRHKVTYVHTRLEASIDLLLTRYIFHPQFSLDDKRRLLEVGGKLGKVLDTIDFAKKLKMAQDAGIIDNDLVKKCFAVNTIRVHFSHPTTYEENIIELKDRKKYLEVLHKLKSAMDRMNDLFIRLFPSKR